MKKIIANIFFMASVCVVCAIVSRVDISLASDIGTLFMCIVTLVSGGVVAKDTLFAQEEDISTSTFFIGTFCLIPMLGAFILIFIICF